MDNDLMNSKGDGPIIRSTPDQRIATFQANANSIYNKYSPFTTYSIGPSQPFVYTKISDSTFSKNLTRYDTQAAPIGSTVRDLKRIGQYMVTGTGLFYTGKQLLLQQQNAFNETRVYNPLSLLKATAKPGSLGAIDYPIRHLETSGGLLNFFKDAFLSTIGFETKDAQKPRIDGTATGVGGVAYSNYAASRGGARAGMLRLGTAKSASTLFETTWVTNPTQNSTSGGFLSNLGSALVNRIKSMIPSTNPLGAFGGTSTDTWAYRPEYKAGKDGAYYAFLADNSGFLTVNAPASQLFYNDGKFGSATAAGKSTVLLASNYHKYYPQKQSDKNSRVWYANKTKITDDAVGVADSEGNTNNLKDLYNRMLKTIEGSSEDTKNQFKKSAERYSEVKDNDRNQYPSYNDIPQNKGDVNVFSNKMSGKAITLDKRGFAKLTIDNPERAYKNSLGWDTYNILGVIGGNRGDEPSDLVSKDDKNQSQDLIFFYFYDLINEKYIPFRATIKGLTDQHQAEWEDVSYIGRADKLFLYKGFTRDVSFNFTVYANSAMEMLPMWERINYLVGLTRPSNYTAERISSAQAYANSESNFFTGTDYQATTGKEGMFMYPPMTTFRLGDMYVDQPCIISSVGVNISDEANWESLRSDKYEYIASPTKTVSMSDAKVRQLPLQVDVNVNLKILEKALSLGSNAHFGKTKYDEVGNETERWVL